MAMARSGIIRELVVGHELRQIQRGIPIRIELPDIAFRQLLRAFRQGSVFTLHAASGKVVRQFIHRNPAIVIDVQRMKTGFH